MRGKTDCSLMMNPVNSFVSSFEDDVQSDAGTLSDQCVYAISFSTDIY